MKKLLKKLVICSLFCTFISVPVNAASVKAQAEKPVKLFFKYSKTLNGSKMRTTISNRRVAALEDKSIKPLKNLVIKQNKKYFKYSIKNVKLSSDKKSAKIKVTVKYNSLYNASYHGTVDAAFYFIQYAFNHGKELSDSQSAKIIQKYIVKDVKKYPAKKTSKTITISTKKYKQGWKIVKISNSVLNVYTSDILKGANTALKKIDDVF